MYDSSSIRCHGQEHRAYGSSVNTICVFLGIVAGGQFLFSGQSGV